MEDQIPCICNGMNEECSKCGGKGFISNDKKIIIKTSVDLRELEKQSKELEKYIGGVNEKMYVDDKKRTIKRPGTNCSKRITLAQLDETNHLHFIGPGNPHRKKIRNIKSLGKKKNK